MKKEHQLSIYNIEDEFTMTVREVADILKVTEKTVLKYAGLVCPRSIKNGIKTVLNEEEVTAIKLKLQQNQHLEQSVKLPKTDLEKELIIQQALQFQSEKIEYLKSKLEEAKPKIEFYDKVGDCEGLHTIAEAAKMLGTGRNRLFRYLRYYKFLRENNEPYQRFIEAGYFEVRENPYNAQVNTQTFITPSGLQYLQKFRNKNLVEVTKWMEENDIKLPIK